MSPRRSREKERTYLDQRLQGLRPASQWAPPASGWIRAIRGALDMSAEQLGRRLGVSKAAVTQLEQSERNSKIRLDSMRKAADALECDLVVAFVPRTTLDQTVTNRAEQIMTQLEQRVDATMALEDQSADLPESRYTALRDELINSGRLWKQ